ncbi:GIY-YIG nuclease family protein [Maricaulaceae bacterium NA33B04]|nr:GIY-YIG nuclease family protein [Maricaulaceae bacterium NA33B04]
MSEARGRSLELFFVDGRPEGMLTARMFNWTGHVLVAPRTKLPDALRRPEASHTGVYLLIGEKDGANCLYIGEGDNISSRIRSHDAAKDWWQTAVFISTQANTLDKAQVRYLEARLLQEAKVQTDNNTSPTPQGLSEASRADMEGFLGNLFVVLPAARVDVFLSKTRPAASTPAAADASSTTFVLKTPKHGLTAQAELSDGEFVVLKGSQARLEWSSTSGHTTYRDLHEQLLASGVLRRDGEVCVFTENYAFTSPSAAAAVVNGRPANGRLDWKRPDTGQTYAGWEAEQLQDASGPDEEAEE